MTDLTFETRLIAALTATSRRYNDQLNVATYMGDVNVLGHDPQTQQADQDLWRLAVVLHHNGAGHDLFARFERLAAGRDLWQAPEWRCFASGDRITINQGLRHVVQAFVSDIRTARGITHLEPLQAQLLADVQFRPLLMGASVQDLSMVAGQVVPTPEQGTALSKALEMVLVAKPVRSPQAAKLAVTQTAPQGATVPSARKATSPGQRPAARPVTKPMTKPAAARPRAKTPASGEAFGVMAWMRGALSGLGARVAAPHVAR